MKSQLLIGNCRNLEQLILYFPYGRLREVSMLILHSSVRKKSKRNKTITKKNPNTQICQICDCWSKLVVSTSQSFGRHWVMRPCWNQLLKHWNLLSSAGLLAPFATLAYLTCWQTRKRMTGDVAILFFSLQFLSLFS